MQPNLKLLKSNQADYWRDFYLDEKRVKLSAKTLTGYANTLSLFIDHLAGCWPPSRADVLGWLALVEARASRVTACSYWATLRAWLNYLDKVGALAPNPVREIAALGLAPSRPKLAPKGVPAGVMVVFLDHLRASSDVAHCRDLSLIHFLWRTGARSGEAAALTRPMLDLRERRALIPAAVAKTDEDRALYFGRKVAADLNAWLEMLDALDYPAPWVFPAFTGHHRPREQPLTIYGVRQMFQRRLAEAGLPRYRVHDLRHGFTKAAMREKISLAAIQKQLGHATPDMVLHYARIFDDQQAEAFRGFGD